MKKRIITLLLMVFVFFFSILDVYAASLGLSASSTSVVKGSTVNVTVKASSLTGKFSVTSSNNNVLSGGTNSEWIENESKTYKFTAKSTGTATITVKTLDVADSNGKKYTDTKTIKITVRDRSNNNNLKSLSVDGSTLTPSFNKDTLEYNVELDSDIEKITINASREDGYASIKGTGSFNVVEGSNKFEIVVTSETGNSKTYTINANVKDNNPIIKTLDGKEYSVVKRNSSLETPPKFTNTNITINEKTIPAFYNEERDITLIGLKDDNGNIRYAKIDKETLEVSKYDTLSYGDKVIVLEDNSEIIENYGKVSKEINGISLNVYQNPKENDFVLVYGMDLNTGNKNFYKYDLLDNTLQRYDNSVINDLSASLNNKLSEYKTILFVLIGLSSLLLILFIISISSKSKMRKKYTKMFNEKKKSVKEKE